MNSITIEPIDTALDINLLTQFVSPSHALSLARSLAWWLSPQLSDAENLEIFGKCNNFHGHGHNYTGISKHIYLYLCTP